TTRRRISWMGSCRSDPRGQQETMSMTKANAEALNHGQNPGQDEQLDRAIEELRGVLQQEEQEPQAASSTAAAASSVIMDIPVEVQIVLGSTEMSVSELMTLQK